MTTLVCWTILLTAVVAWLTGYHEAVVMVKPYDKMHDPVNEWPTNPTFLEYETTCRRILYQFDLGPRGHVWFRWYHAIAVGMRLGWAALGAWLWTLAAWSWWYVMLVALVLVVMNSAYEFAYSRGRFAVWYNIHPEHFNLADIVSFHVGSRFAHAVRLVAIVGLTTLTIGG